MQSLKTGDWVTLERIRVYAWMLLVFWLIGILVVIFTANGGVDFLGRPLGTDFSNVWSAGRLVLDGHANAAYDIQIHHQVQQAAFKTPDIPYYGWHYPPFFLFIAAALAVLPYGWALAAWLAATYPLYLSVMRHISDVPYTALVAAAYPAVAVNIIHGQNGFLSAALLGAGLMLLDRKPIIAGLCIGLLAYKPQFGVLIPLVLAITGRWTVIMVAGLTVGALMAASTLVFGLDIWQAFFSSTEFTRKVVMEAGALSPDKVLSLFAALRMWGTPVNLAYVGHGLLAVGVVAAQIWLWRKPVAQSLQSAGLVVGALLVTPYALDYDLMIAGLGLAWFTMHGLKTGFLAWEKTALVFVWCLPLISRMAAILLTVPLGLIGLLVFFGLILRRAQNDLINGS
ncbi:MAG: hypothetical protein COB46_07110 [Rhodospirillaceae bacterium]|nr:MAG: hypothetical protein COB46_07110 [Rhodospirillaceae bacterium]